MGKAVRFRQTNVPRQPGETARMKVVQGPDSGSIFVFTGAKLTMGRGEDNDIIISDLKASRKHAEFSLTAIGWRVKDLSSANGIVFRGKPTSSTTLKTGDAFTIGGSTFEFIASPEANTMMLVAPAKTVGQIKVDQVAFEQQQKRVRSVGQIGGGAHVGTKRKRNPLLMIGAGILLFVIISGDKSENQTDEAGSQKSKKETIESRDLASYLPKLPAQSSKAAEVFFKTGFREFREHNFLRARTNFETVLQISPTHTLARKYLTECTAEIKRAVDEHKRRGQNNASIGRLGEAKAQFEAILRLLAADPNSAEYKDAETRLEAIKKEMSGGSS